MGSVASSPLTYRHHDVEMAPNAPTMETPTKSETLRLPVPKPLSPCSPAAAGGSPSSSPHGMIAIPFTYFCTAIVGSDTRLLMVSDEEGSSGGESKPRMNSHSARNRLSSGDCSC